MLVREMFNGAAWQRCIVHLERDARGWFAKRQDKIEATAALKAVFSERGPELVRAMYRRAIDEFAVRSNRAGELLEDAEADALAYLDFPYEHHVRLRTNNVQERANVRRTNQWRKPEEGYIAQDKATPVIASHYGERILPSTLGRWWIDDRVKYGLEGWCLHELRHTYLTMLALSGVHPKVMQELAGHYSSQITMDIYTQVNMDAKRKAAAAVSKVF